MLVAITVLVALALFLVNKDFNKGLAKKINN